MSSGASPAGLHAIGAVLAHALAPAAACRKTCDGNQDTTRSCSCGCILSNKSADTGRALTVPLQQQPVPGCREFAFGCRWQRRCSRLARPGLDRTVCCKSLGIASKTAITSSFSATTCSSTTCPIRYGNVSSVNGAIRRCYAFRADLCCEIANSPMPGSWGTSLGCPQSGARGQRDSIGRISLRMHVRVDCK